VLLFRPGRGLLGSSVRGLVGPGITKTFYNAGFPNANTHLRYEEDLWVLVLRGSEAYNLVTGGPNYILIFSKLEELEHFSKEEIMFPPTLFRWGSHSDPNSSASFVLSVREFENVFKCNFNYIRPRVEEGQIISYIPFGSRCGAF
jgi:hypothetical protein